MSLKGEEAYILASDYTDKTIEGAGGLKGEPGKSAYEIAVDNGFEGSEQEWLEYLKASGVSPEEFKTALEGKLDVNDVAVGAIADGEGNDIANTYLTKEQGMGYIHKAVGQNNATGYVKVAQLTANITNNNMPIEIKFARRGDMTPTSLFIRFASATAISTFKYNGYTNLAYLVQSDTSVWDLYIRKAEAWDTIKIFELRSPYYNSGDELVTVTFTDELATELPEGYVQASVADVNVNASDAVHSETTDKLKTAVSIGKAKFDGSTGLSHAQIMGRGALSSTSNTYAGKYAKFATMTVPNAWGRTCGIFHIFDSEGGMLDGILFISVKVGTVLDAPQQFKLQWLSLNDATYENIVCVENVGGGVYDFYIHAIQGYRTYGVTILDVTQDYFTLYTNQSFVDTVTATYTSSLYNVSQKAMQDGKGNVITDTYAKIHDASSTPYDTGRVWLNGSPIMRTDFCVMIKNTSPQYASKQLPWNNINSALSDVCIVGAQVAGSIGMTSDYYIGNVDYENVLYNSQFIEFEEIPAASGYDTIMIYGYVEYVASYSISAENITKVFE